MPFAELPSPMQRFIKSRRVFHFTRGPMYWGTMPRLDAELALQPGERLLDIGCGTGLCARLARDGAYLGVDTALDSLQFARRRFADRRRHFAAMHANALALRPQSFDKGLIVNVAHHLDDTELDALLSAVRRIVRGAVVLLDAAPDVANRTERLLLRFDRGEHMRPRAALRSLLARRYAIEREDTFHNTLRIVPQVLFRLAVSGAA